MKTLIKVAVILSFVIMSGLLSCSDDTNPIIRPGKFTIDNFPHEIGTVWKYQFRSNDIQSFSIDTLFVRVDDTIRITADSLLVYKIIAEEMTDSSKTIIITYWHISGDTVTYYKPNADSFIVTQKLVFPLELGSSWTTGTAIVDTNEVVDISSEVILDKTYQNSYQIRRDYVQSLGKVQRYSYVPDIGLINSFDEQDIFPSVGNGTWELIDFYQRDSLTLADFPTQVGASWDYKVVNNMLECLNCYDSVIVTIQDSIINTDNNVIYQSWLFDYPNNEIIRKNWLDQKRLYIQWHQYPVFFTLRFPLKVGQYWSLRPGRSSSYKVLDRQTVITEAGTFKDVYYLKGSSGDWYSGAYSEFEMWIVKNIGIVKINYLIQTNEFSEDKSWELQQYNPNDPAPSFTIDKFPSYDQMTRTYEIFDSRNNLYDTVLVQVAESSTVAIWNYTSSDSSWQELVSIEDNVVTFSSSERIRVAFKSFEFPIVVRNKWITFPNESQSTVVFGRAITYPIGHFFPCYAIETKYNCGDDCYKVDIDWICPNVGFVKRQIINSELGINETWRLIDYSEEN